MGEPKAGEVFHPELLPEAAFWEYVQRVDGDLVVTRNFSGAVHHYTMQSWLSLVWVRVTTTR